jgi:tRNA(Leu) C34 or U34 (ribose-2'-O)-methylase TrmL
MRHRASTVCKDELLGPNGVTQEDYEARIAGLDVWIKLLAEAHIEWGEFLYIKN